MAALSALLTYVLPYAPGAAEPTAERAILDTCIDFCRNTLVWQHTGDADTTTANEAEYDVELPGGSAPALPLSVWVDGSELTPATPDTLASLGDWQSLEPGRPKFFMAGTGKTIRMIPAPDAAYTWSASAAVAPTRSATTIPDILIDRYADAITDGALARLYALPNTPMYNPSASLARTRTYNNAVSMAYADVVRQFSRSPMRATPLGVWV